MQLYNIQFYNKFLMEQNETCEMWTEGLPQYRLMGFERLMKKLHFCVRQKCK